MYARDGSDGRAGTLGGTGALSERTSDSNSSVVWPRRARSRAIPCRKRSSSSSAVRSSIGPGAGVSGMA
jgi:hypothetical protein